VGKLCRDEAEQDDLLGQLRELEKVGARDELLLAQNAEVHRHGTNGDQDETAVEHFAAHRDRARPTEPGPAMVGIDSGFCEALLLHRRHGVSEGSLELDKLVPCDYRLAAADAFATHAAGMINSVRCPDQDFFRIAAAQLARATERQVIDDRHTPSGRATARRGHRRGRSGSDGDKIVRVTPPESAGYFSPFTGRCPSAAASCRGLNATPWRCWRPTFKISFAISLRRSRADVKGQSMS